MESRGAMRADCFPSRGEVVGATSLSLLVQTFVSMLLTSVPVLAPLIAADRGWKVTAVALFPSILFATAFVASFGVPRMLGALGGMGLSVACLAASAIGLLCLLSPIVPVVAATPVALGVAAASINPASSQILRARSTVTNAALVMSIKQTGVPLGSFLAGVVVPLLATQSTWRGAVMAITMASIVVALLLLPSVRWLDGPPAPSTALARNPFEPLRRLVAIPGMRAVLLATFVFMAMQMCLRTFFISYLVGNRILELSEAGLALGVSQVMGIFGQIVWGAVSDRLLTVRWVIVLLGVLMGAAALLAAMMTAGWSSYAIFGVAALFGISTSSFSPVMLGEVARRSPPEQVGALTSGAQLFLTGGALVGPILFGAVAAQSGFARAFLISGTFPLALAIGLVFSGNRTRRG
jgi:MFS family permease